MKSNKKFLIFAALIILFFSIGFVSANDLNSNQSISNYDNQIIEDSLSNSDGYSTLQDNEITVENWDDLQYYCSLNDTDYILNLKENTNYYPTDPNDESCQIQVNNNITIKGSSGAYFGDTSENARSITYLPISVPENSGIGITLKGITFKWISCTYQPNAIFLQMAGNASNVIENCKFDNCTMTGGHSSVVYLLRGDVKLTNCTFTNITSDFGCLSLYDPKDDSTKTCTHAHGEVTDCYFEGNYARTEPGCINNCGVLVVRNSTFYRNSAFWWAGAIHTHGGANTTIYDSNFTDNVAGWNGGALYTYSYLQIYNTVFKGNNCTTNNGGGAIGASKYLHSPYIYIKDSLFENNENLCWAYTNESTTSLGRGGAISIMDEGGLIVLNTTFIENSASMGTAICAISQGSYYGSPDVTIIGNRFINHKRSGDVLVIKLNYDSLCEISDNYYYGNSIVFSKLKLTADDLIGDEVTLHIDASLKNENYYDSDILEKSDYDVYVDGQYYKTVTGTDFVLNLKNIGKCQVYVVPSISISKSNEVSVGTPKEYIYVSQKDGDDSNNGSLNSPLSSITKACELASSCGNIIILDGTFTDSNITIDYDLSITGQGNAIISSNDNLFNINNTDVVFKNIIFSGCKSSSSSSRIIKQNSGILEIENCTFTDNYLNTLIESGGILEVSSSKFINNTGILINANNYQIEDSLFDKNKANLSVNVNTLIKSSNGVNCKIVSCSFSNNMVKDGCVYYAGGKYTLTVCETSFTANTAKYSQSSQTFSSCIYAYSGTADVQSSLFINNTDTGTYSAVICTSTEIHVSNSIFLANDYKNLNKLIINSKTSSNFKKIYCDGNWWGNTQDNISVSPAINANSNCNSWLFLNSSINTTSLVKGESALIKFDLNNLFSSDSGVSYYDASSLPEITWDITSEGGQSGSDEITLVNGFAEVTYTLTSDSGKFKAVYNGVNVEFNFTKSKILPDITVDVNDVYVGEDVIVGIEISQNATGNITVCVGDTVQTKEIQSSETFFTFNNLSAGSYDAEVIYSGDGEYETSIQNATFAVNKYNSAISIFVSEIEINKDVILTMKLTDGATGNITLIINNSQSLLEVRDSKAQYTINSISKGDYDITAVYNGDGRYLESSDNIHFAVGKLNTTITVSAEDIIYGQDAVFDIILDVNATGNITVFVENKNKTANLLNGRTSITLSNLSVGNKEVNVIYSGDNNYNSIKYSTSLEVSKADTTLIIKSEDIKIGSDEIIEVNVLSGVEGNITLQCGDYTVTKTLNRLGKVIWTLEGLDIGEYSVSAVLNSSNYNVAENSTKFIVCDYSSPQWANEGYDIYNSGKSPYDIDSNGEILWSFDADGGVFTNIVIDCEGNIYFITSSGIYSVDSSGNELWNYDPAGEGNYSGLAVARDVVIAPKSGNTIYFINQTSGVKFGNSNIYQGSSLFAPVVDSNANIYIASEYQYSSEDYKLVIIPYSIWRNGGNPVLISLGKSAPSSAPVVVSDNIVVVGCEDSLKIIDISTNQIISSISGNTNGIRPVVGPGGMIYAVLDGNIAEITSQGSVIWKSRVTGGIGNYLVLDEESGVYTLDSQGKLCKYDLVDGTESILSNLTFTSPILIGSEGNIYVASDEFFYAFDSQGSLLWKTYIGSEIVTAPVAGENGMIYFATSSKVYALTEADLKDPDLTVCAENITAGETAKIIFNLAEDAVGKLYCVVDESNYSVIFDNGSAILEVPDLTGGKHTVNVTYSGDSKYYTVSRSVEINVSRLNTVIEIIGSDIYYSNEFSAVLKDSNNNILSGQSVNVVINGSSYTLTTDNEGMIYITLKLNEGIYDASVNFKGSSNYNPSNASSQINMLSTIQANDMKRGYNSGTDFTATFLTDEGNPLAGSQVRFYVNGVEYNVTTNSYGITVLNLKLAVGTYKIISFNPITGENTTHTATIVKRITNNNALKMDYLDGSYFKVRIIGDDGNYVGADEVVTFKIGSRSVTAKTNANGYASVKITDVPKTYTVKTTYKGYSVSNKLVVKQVLKAKNVSKKKAKSYKFSATLKTSKGKAIVGKKITFKIKNKKYTAKTNKKGVATVTIKLNLKVGKYTIVSIYSKTKIKNKLTIKK